ncbi:Beta-xylosidase [Pelagirhabdus alkalitolerans]|uniref:Beta-xylosidase n=1 Tax=Pelagirhabdus alkalitolerans TaxID=1612202 RepID=A0A1G6GQZ6_9BACI|nr:glycoside hydrolase 43 family protein [Pelagirhabdus alkalitolerans]SDB83626.1 Beta-xylosidase [Pelagirhabdus alkalitolerans]
MKVSDKNPVIWADVPDPCVIRVGDVYYMSSTTMHMNPGVPIMMSRDLVNWELLTYVYDVLEHNDPQTLSNGQEEYGHGSWASSLRYHEGVFYLAVASFSADKTYIFKTKDITSRQWKKSTFDGVYHDMSLLFDTGRVFMTYGGGDINIIELTQDATAIKEDGLHKTLIPNASGVLGEDYLLPAEGSHFQKNNEWYYVFLIMMRKDGERIQLMYRSDRVDGEYEGRIALENRGIAQGGLVDTADGDWYALLFQDRGAVGRVPYLVDITWDNGWPLHHVTLDEGSNQAIPNVVAADDFDDHELVLAWQWNHNPDKRYWSLTERQGFLRLKNGSVRDTLISAKNTLTQRTFGPFCSGEVAMEVDHMKAGDVAGLALLQENYGFVGVKADDDRKSIVMVRGNSEEEKIIEEIPLETNRIYFKIECDFENRNDKAHFYYRTDQSGWFSIGDILQMKYTLPKHFMGYRFALFNYATKAMGGYADFDYFRIGE